MSDKSVTRDSILGGTLTIVQPASGYRFSLDSILLADFARPRKRDRVLDLGCGCGVITAMIALVHQPRAVVGIEVQPDLAECARRNALDNGLATMSVIQADLRQRKITGIDADSFDYVVANPPYRPSEGGRESRNESRRIARGGGGASLRDFVQAVARCAKGNGRVAIIFTAIRTTELIAELRAKALEPKRIRFVHPYANASASTVMVEARKRGRVEARIEPPLIVWERPGVYTAEVESILSGRNAVSTVVRSR
jgi:tRNA1Val (adenine37-N6)-methyltransferase